MEMWRSGSKLLSSLAVKHAGIYQNAAKLNEHLFCLKYPLEQYAHRYDSYSHEITLKH